MRIYFMLCVSCITFLVNAQPTIEVNGFGHLEYEFYHMPDTDENKSEFNLGEHDLFVNGRLNKKISFLSELVVREDKKTSSGFGVSLERALIRYNYKGNHSIHIGKMHTAINYWNDVYHHGRIFFPTIDRPLNFDFFMPIHTLGVKAAGYNLGDIGFGYDLQIANSMASTDFESEGINFSYMASARIEPVDGTRFMIGYYRDFLHHNTHGPQAHSGTYHNDDYHGSIAINKFCLSIARFERKLELLNEFGYTQTATDSLGRSGNITNYTYIGYQINQKYVPFVMMDFIRVGAKELHVTRLNGIKFSLGMRLEFDPRCNLKIQLEHYGGINSISDVPGMQRKYEIKFQLAYAI